MLARPLQSSLLRCVVRAARLSPLLSGDGAIATAPLVAYRLSCYAIYLHITTSSPISRSHLP